MPKKQKVATLGKNPKLSEMIAWAEQNNMRFEIGLQKQAAQQNMHWAAGIVRRFKQFPVVKFILSLWHSLATRK